MATCQVCDDVIERSVLLRHQQEDAHNTLPCPGVVACDECWRQHIVVRRQEYDDERCMASGCRRTVSFGTLVSMGLPVFQSKRWRARRRKQQQTKESFGGFQCNREQCDGMMYGHDPPYVPRGGYLFVALLAFAGYLHWPCQLVAGLLAALVLCMGTADPTIVCTRGHECHVDARQGSVETRRVLLSTRPCPTCHVRIEKDGGCPRMRCTRCRSDFCWVCLSKLSYGQRLCHWQ